MKIKNYPANQQETFEYNGLASHFGHTSLKTMRPAIRLNNIPDKDKLPASFEGVEHPPFPLPKYRTQTASLPVHGMAWHVK